MAFTAALAAGALGSALSAIGSIRAGNTEAQNLEQQAEVMKYNAAIQERQAALTAQGAAASANQQQRSAEQLLGQQRAATGQNRTGFGGTSGMLLDQSAANAELDRQNILYQGMLNQQAQLTQSQFSKYGAESLKRQAPEARLSGYLGAGGALLQGIGNFAYGNAMSRGFRSGGKF